jgi:Arc/MetJ-type ribon-helix-helix transcriptional regulator
MTDAYTVAEIAVAVGWSKRRVTTALHCAPPSQTRIVSGNNARAWTALSLPESLLREVERLCKIHRFRSPDELLKNSARRWQPAIGIARVCEADVRRADQLREALSRALQADEQTSVSERARLALPDYRRVFGREITDRQLRTLIARTMDRDRGARDFGRLEIYLPEIPRAKANLAIAKGHFQELSDDFATLADRNNRTVTERAFCWRKIAASYSARVSAGQKANAVKKALCDFVRAELPSLAGSGQAVKRNLNRKLSVATQSGLDALIDRRTENSGPRRKLSNWSEDITKLARQSRHETGARISQAYRELYNGTTANGEQFSAEFREHFGFNVRRAKSDVPAAVRAAVRPILEATEASHRGPKTARLSGPSYRRDWSNVFAGDSYSADDFTFNHPFIEWDEHGEFIFEGQRFNLTRGQTLLFCDERSLRIHGYYLTPRPNYGAGTICAGINRICMDEMIGLPFRRFLFERGAWKARAVKSAVDWARIDQIFSQEGVEFRSRESVPGLPSIVHATTPKAKVIERIGGAVQNLMEGAPGYVGRNQRLDGPEGTAQAIARLRRFEQRCTPERDPRKVFLTKEQFCAELENVVRRFNAESQNGKMLNGRSPEEAWKEFHPKDGPPHKVLPESLRYLLATEVAAVTVTEEGITLPRRGQPTRNYCGHPRLGELIGEKVRVRFNAEMPEVITVCHLRSDPKNCDRFQ